ncbi:MAG: cell division protein FtsZ, partial [Ignavibacteriales bacterium]|nr:cell division protein FtsZ [Ignavibacteriales bacterium]
VVDDSLGDSLMVTVVATGFSKKAVAVQPKPKPTANLIERIPSGPTELQKYDEPTYIRRGVELRINQQQEPAKEREKIDRSDLDKPAFLRKIMD